ncbi:eukaryotic translation initiation factor 4 gamma 1a isoform X2 [Corythoichthys intestinalis]|uniref:eukaryotic translation initiation factor 4 gamma 1a isoform X2 n=1 Tax=Corythoichthys intestinalis TaxID=161448 RepID=UPI0025A4DCD9|nr:eukaryotic translation initiation factor 4 gamma 1a isoform X2 [Corythoichthys intestinalis]
MNKPPQPITGPPSVPNPAPSPGLTQATYGPGQPQSLVFATPAPPQMNSAPQPRQFAAGPRTLHQQGGYRALQGYYSNRPAMATSAPRVQTSSGPRPVGPTHVYPPSSQMMMIPQQQLSFAGSPQGYFIPPGQYRAPYMPPTQQYPVTSGSAGYYAGTSPAEYPGYAGAYYPAQSPYTPSVQSAPVMINPPQQQQPAPPPQQPPAPPQGPPKRERKPIRIRDPTQGGRDITEEIMSGGRSTSTPTPPQANITEGGSAQTNGEVIPPATTVTRRDDNIEQVASVETPPPPSTSNPEPTFEATLEADNQNVPAEESEPVDPDLAPEVPTQMVEDQPDPNSTPPASTPSSVAEVEEVGILVSDTVDAPVCPSPPTAQEEKPQAAPALCEKMPEKRQEEEMQVMEEKEGPTEMASAEPVAEVAEAVNPVCIEPEEMPPKLITEAPQLPPPEPAAPEPELRLAPKKQEEPPLANGLPQDMEELGEEDTTPCNQPEVSQSQESTPVAKIAVPVVEHLEVKETEVVVAEQKKEVVKVAKSEEVSPAPISMNCPVEESAMQAATSVPKKRRNMKEINKKEAIGDLLDAFTEEQVAKPAPEPSSTPAEPVPVVPAEPPAEVADETWEEKEDKQNAEPETKSETADKKYQYKEEQWKPINPEEKKRYDRKFLLGFQFISASMNKPEGLPAIDDVVLDKVNKTPLRPADTGRLNVRTDFTPSYVENLGSRSVGGMRGPIPGPRRSQQGQRKEHRKIITSMSLNDDVQLNKAEKAWKPSTKKAARGRGEDDGTGSNDEELTPEQAITQETLKRLRSILNKLTPQKFQDLMNQVKELTIDTEERLKGAIDLIFEKAILEPSFSVAYANMCRCLSGLKVPTTDKPGHIVTFRKLLLNRCQKEFEKDQDDDEFLDKKQKEMEAAKDEEERERMRIELEEARDKARRRSLGNIKFIGELFKLKMLTEAIMHDCVLKLLKNHDEESLECLCRLLSTIGKDLDFEKAKPRMDQYFNQMEKIIKERKTSSRIRFMLQDVLDLKKCNWVPRRGDQGPKTIDQIHKDAEMEEHREQIKVQQQLMSKKDTGGGRMGGGMGGRGPHIPGGGRGSQPQDEGWNTVPISKRFYDSSRLKLSKHDNLDLNNQRLAPSGKSWGKGSSGGMGVKTATADQDSRPTTSNNRFGALQQSGSLSSDSDRRASQRSSSSRERGGDRERSDRDRERFDRLDRDDRSTRSQNTKRSFSRETEERGGRGGDNRPSNEPMRRVASMTDSRDRGSRDRGSRDRGSRDRGSRDRVPSKDVPAKRESAPTPPSLPEPAMSEEAMEKKSTAIIDEFLHINDFNEATRCVDELKSSSALLYVFVRKGVESTLERSAKARELFGTLLPKLTLAGTLPIQQYFKGLSQILEVADDMAIDIPHIWLYLAEIITPMLLEGGIPMGQLFSEISKPLLPQGKAGVLLVQVLHLLCKGMTHSKVGALWKEAGLNWNDFLPKNDDVNKFVTEQQVEFTTGEGQSKESTKKALSGDELRQELERLLRDKASDQRLKDWVEANLDEQQRSSNQFVRALMTATCQLAITGDPYKVDLPLINSRASLLQHFLNDEQKELQALYALQALMVQMEQPANLLRMFFDALYDADVIKEDAFYKWESSKDAAEQNGKGVALKSVTAFFTWLREPEEESDKD